MSVPFRSMSVPFRSSVHSTAGVRDAATIARRARRWSRDHQRHLGPSHTTAMEGSRRTTRRGAADCCLTRPLKRRARAHARGAAGATQRRHRNNNNNHWEARRRACSRLELALAMPPIASTACATSAWSRRWVDLKAIISIRCATPTAPPCSANEDVAGATVSLEVVTHAS